MEFIKHDGWDTEELRETGLLDVMGEIDQIKYEIEMCRRGSYAVSGDTVEDLKDDLINLAIRLQEITEGL
jgi:hypothetical protein